MKFQLSIKKWKAEVKASVEQDVSACDEMDLLEKLILKCSQWSLGQLYQSFLLAKTPKDWGLDFLHTKIIDTQYMIYMIKIA